MAARQGKSEKLNGAIIFFIINMIISRTSQFPILDSMLCDNLLWLNFPCLNGGFCSKISITHEIMGDECTLFVLNDHLFKCRFIVTKRNNNKLTS